jgi:hypothetical protein
MVAFICFVVTVLISPFKSKSRLEAENAVVPIGNSILLATDIESRDAPAICERFVA